LEGHPVGKAIRAVVGVLAVVACLLAVRHIYLKRTVAGNVAKVDDRYEEATTVEDFTSLKQEYEAFLAKAPTGSDRRHLQGRIASCEAWIAFLHTTDRPSIRKYEDCIEKMKKAKELTGDIQSVWSRKIAEFERRYKEALGPDLAKMRAEHERLSKMPFAQAVADLETLYRWRGIWHEQGLYVDDKEREGIFAKARQMLLDNYARLFEESIAKAKTATGKSEEALSIRSAPLGPGPG